MANQILTSFGEYKDTDGDAYNPSPTPAAYLYDGDVTDGSYISSMTVNRVKTGVYRAIYSSEDKFNAIMHWYTTDTDVDQDGHGLYSIWTQDVKDDVDEISGSTTTINTNADEISGSISSLALEATLTAMKGSGWTTETLVDIRAAIASEEITAEDIWTYFYRTLTPSSLQTTSEPVISTVPIKLYTHSSNTIAITCIDADEIWYTMKSSAGQTDDEAMLQVSKTGSLLRLDGQSPSALGLTASNATLTHSGSSIVVFISGSAAPKLNGAGNKGFTGEVKRRMNSGAMPIVSQHPIELNGGLTRSL